MNRTIRARLTLWYAGLAAMALTAFSIGVLWLHARAGRAQFDSELSSLAAAMTGVMDEELDETGSLAKAVEETRESTEVPGRAIAILDAQGRPLAAHWQGLSYRQTALDQGAAPHPGVSTIRSGNSDWRVLIRGAQSPQGPYAILVAGTLDQLARQQQLLRRTLLVATPLVVLATAALAWWAASSALRPVTMMAAQAEALTARSTDWHLDAPTQKDELGQLARAFNRLLARLRAASEQQRQFMADASHELRTPVSVIQTAAEVTLDKPARDETDYREALAIVGEQSARLGRMVNDMPVLARADAGGFRLSASPVYADEIAAECVRAIAVVAAARDVRIATDLQPDLLITADDGLLRQLVTNLLDNAVQHTPAGGVVTVSVHADRRQCTIAVCDTGPGIAPADRDRVFERFVRLDAARSSSSGTGRAGGAGLGLPIARWIAEQHGGSLTLDTSGAGGGRGCRFVAQLPLTQATSRSDRS